MPVRFVFLFLGMLYEIKLKVSCKKGLQMKPVYLLAEQHEKLLSELRNLKRKDRPEVIQDIAEAREHGDLKENAEYAAAKEKQVLIERKIARLEETLSRSRIMTEDMMQSGVVHVGARVKIVDVQTDEETVCEIVPTAEFNTFDPDAVSADSPVGKALIGKKVDDKVEIQVPAGKISYRIIEVL